MESAGILAGPMLRRVDTDPVATCVATDCPVEVEDAAISFLDTLIQLDTAMKTTSIQAGHRLFIHLVQVRGQFPTETLLGYDLFFRVGKIINTLASLRSTHKNEDSVTYDGLPYPSFFIPASAAPTYLYALCRKFHGKGDDALIAANPLFPVIRMVAEHYIGKEDLCQLQCLLRH